MNPKVHVARASLDEIMALRAEVLRAGLPLSSAKFSCDDDPNTVHYAARESKRVIGCLTVAIAPYPCENLADFQLRGMAVAAAYRGQGVGRALLMMVHRDIGHRLWCNARAPARAFYERFGWTVSSDSFSIDGIGLHYRMLSPET